MAFIFVMTEPSDPAVSVAMLCLWNSFLSTLATFLATSAALPVEDVRRIAQEVASILKGYILLQPAHLPLQLPK